MRVGISLLTLAPGAVGGSETYARLLCQALARVGTHDYTVFTPDIAAGAGSPLHEQAVVSYRSGRSVPARVRSLVAEAASGRVRKEMRLDELDAIHFPLTTIVPRGGRPPAVVTVHDVLHLIRPEFFSRATLLYRRLAYEGSVRRARLVIAISAHVRDTLLERVDIDPDRVVVVHSGIDHQQFTPPTGGAPREPFLLYPSFPWPHKNHERLIAAFAVLRRTYPELRLVLTGGSYPAFTGIEGVDVRGTVPVAELARLYRTAAAMVLPSLYEGFGQPLLEAMACGCPVAASDVAAIPEICGGAALLFDPTRPEAIAAAVERVLQESAAWSERGIARAAGFSWDGTAAATDAVYTRLTEPSNRLV